MSDTTRDRAKNSSLAQRESSRLLEVKGVLDQLPTWALAPLMVIVFGLLMADIAVTDPIPVIDEAALLWALVSGMRTLGVRRKSARVARDEVPGLQRQVVADVEARRVAAPGQPLTVSGQPIA